MTYTRAFGNVLAGNYSMFEVDGTGVAIGDATTYNDLPPVPLVAARVGANLPDLTVLVGNIKQYAFKVDDEVFGAQEVLHEYKEGTNFNVHVHWATNGTDGTNRYVKWELEYALANVMESAPYTSLFSSSTPKSVEFLIPASTGDRAHTLSVLDSAVSGSGIKIGAYFIYRFRRFAAAGTAPSASPFAIALGIHINQDTAGSRTVSAK
jgi:hypothetical protein